jgi:hypothetical protein
MHGGGALCLRLRYDLLISAQRENDGGTEENEEGIVIQPNFLLHGLLVLS